MFEKDNKSQVLARGQNWEIITSEEKKMSIIFWLTLALVTTIITAFVLFAATY